MKKLISALAVMGCLMATQAANAGAVWFAGTASSNDPSGYAGNWSMKVNYTPNSSGANATAVSGTLEIDGKVLTFGTQTVGAVTLSPELTVQENNPLDRVRIRSGLIGTGVTALLTSLFSPVPNTDLGVNPFATDANIQALTKLGSTVNGSILNASGIGGGTFDTITLSGSVVAPEPGSIALLSGLGLVVGRRLLKRRAKKQEAAV